MGFFKLYGFELLELAENIAKEKGLSKEKIISSMEDTINFAAKERYGNEFDIRTTIDPKNGDVTIGKYYTIVQNVENPAREISLDAAKLLNIKQVGRKKQPKYGILNAENSAINGEKNNFNQKIVEQNSANSMLQGTINSKYQTYGNNKIRQEDRPVRVLYEYFDLNFKSDLKIGDSFKYEDLPIFDFGRAASINARKIIHQGIKAAEKEKQYDEFKDRVGEIVSGIVKRSEFNNVIVDIGRSEAILMRVNLIPRETFRIGDRITALVEHVKYDEYGYQIFLSRNSEAFLQKLMEQQVPEIYDKIIEIKSIARDPGSHAKVAVFCKDPNIDPVGTCVGIRGSRIQPIVQELQGEKIDIVIWSDNVATFIANAMSPSEVTKIVYEQDEDIYEVIVPDSQLSVAIGRRGQNVKLASKLTGKTIDIISENSYQDKRNKEFKALTSMFMEALDCEEVIANLIVVEGFTKVEQIVEASIDRLNDIEGFDSDLSNEIKSRAEDYLSKKEELLKQKIKDLNVDPKILKIKQLSLDMVVSLADSNILTINDLADLSSYELLDALFAYEMDVDTANEIVLEARKIGKII